MKPTMSDVGRLAGVTKMTVSRALRNPHSVRAETLLRVRKAASELNYRRSKSRTQSLTLVWLMFRPENDPNSSSELLAYQIDGANDASLQRNFSLQMVYFDEKQPLDALLWRISTRNADGVLLAADHPDMLPLQFEMEDLVQCIEKMAIPLVAVGASSRLLHTNRIYKNDVAGSYAAVSHLLQLGHRRIAFFSRTPEKHQGYLDRYQGYSTALRSAGIEPDPALYQVAGGYGLLPECVAQLEALLALPEPPTAIFAVNDYLAMEVIKLLSYRKRRVPEDISVIGYDNIGNGQLCSPPLTSVDTRIRRMQQQAINLLCDLIENPSDDHVFTQMEFEPQLVIRRSCSRILRKIS